MARTGSALYAAGATLALVWLLLPHPIASNDAVLVGVVTVAYVAAALSWVALAGIAAPGSRPYPIGSSNGSVWDVVFGFNGTDRLAGGPGAAGTRPGGR